MPPVVASTKTRVTQSDVARVAGVHNTTVSLALRNCASIPESTRKRIQAIANQLGYHPDPTLQALVAYRTGRMPNRLKDTIAYVTHWNTRWGWRTLPAYDRAYIGAQRRANELGYQLEHFWLGEPGLTPRRLSSMLYHRNITGVLLASHGEERDDLGEIDWSRLAAVKIGCQPRSPALHRVTDDHNGMIRFAMRRIIGAGFQRVGLAMASWRDDSADQAWSAGYSIEQNRLPSETRIPILRFTGDQSNWISECPPQAAAADVSSLGRWFEAYRPEVIVGFSPLMLTQLKQLGISVPEEVAYVDLCLESSDSSIAGIRQNHESTGEAAVATLVGQLQQNSIGLPRVPTTLLVGGTWVDGASLPVLRRPESWNDENKIHPQEYASVVPLTA